MRLGRKTRRRSANPRPGAKWRLGPRDEKPRSMFRSTHVKHLPGEIDPPAKFAGSWQDRLLKRPAPRPRAERQQLMPSHLWQSQRRRWQPKRERPTTSARAPGRRPTRLSLVQLGPRALTTARRYGLGRTMQRRAMTMRKIKEGGKFTRKRRRKQRTRRRRRKRNMRKRRKRRKTRK